MQWLDRITGTITMYRLVLICLLALLVETVLLSLTGVLSQSPLAILCTGAIAVAFTLAGNWVFARLFRMKPHAESSLLTGLLLLFIFEPVDPTQSGYLIRFIGIAIAGVIASASKYLLAWRGRHVFNPAALAAFVVTLISPLGDFAAWWLATAWLLPVTLGFAVLYRTRRSLMGAVFVVAVFLLTFWVYGGNGAPVTQTLLEPFTTFSTIFFAGFMLSEPLTMPPHRWQQLAEAFLVAIVFTLPFTVAGFSTTTPQFALLVGNLFAFFFGQRRGIRLDFVGRQRLTAFSWELSFRPQKPVRFRAGQYMELTIPHPKADVRGQRRVFSIASAPVERDIIRFGLNTAERSSSFKSALLSLQPGEIVTGTSVAGDFVLPKDLTRRLLFVAGGIGITPFMSHLEQKARAGEDRDIVVIYSASGSKELAYTERLTELGAKVLLIAPAAPVTMPASWTYLGAGPLTAEMLTSTVPDLQSRASYVSGAPAFVHHARALLRKAHVRSIKTDYFSGYSARPVPVGTPIRVTAAVD
jgi:ferredoxin-NADP reductase/Na+-transporting NADH:ubiquinone oxidoreductase subunit NqrB